MGVFRFLRLGAIGWVSYYVVWELSAIKIKSGVNSEPSSFKNINGNFNNIQDVLAKLKEEFRKNRIENIRYHVVDERIFIVPAGGAIPD